MPPIALDYRSPQRTSSMREQSQRARIRTWSSRHRSRVCYPLHHASPILGHCQHKVFRMSKKCIAFGKYRDDSINLNTIIGPSAKLCEVLIKNHKVTYDFKINETIS